MSFSSQMFSRAVFILIAINVVLFFLDQQTPGGLVNMLGLHFPENDRYHVWQYLSHMFMHGGLMHLAFNMYALWMFGSALESLLGKTKFLIFYFVCGIGAALIYNFVNAYQFNSVYSVLASSGLNKTDIMQMISEYSYPPAVINEAQASKMFGVFYSPMVGASGAIYGILVAFAVFFPNNKLMLVFIPYPIPAKIFVPVLIGLDLFSGVTGFSLFVM